MKQQSGVKLTIIAVVCGIAAAALTVFYLKQIETKYKKASKPVQQEMVAVVVPKQNLKKGSVITAQSVASRKVPREFLPSNAVMAKDFKNLVNRTILMSLEKAKPITWEAVTGKSAKTFSETIELGRRARSVKVNKIDSFDGLLRPGDRIDLMGDFTLSALGLASNVRVSGSEPLPEDIIMPILENVEVLAAGKEDLHGRKYERSANKKSADGFNMEFTVISLNLTPKQVARVELAEGVGDMFAVLRHPEDTSEADFKYLGVELLLEKDEPEKVDLVLGADGKAVGMIVGDNIVDENGNIVGKIVNGKAVGLDGKALGQIVNDVDAADPLLNVAEVVDVVRDANGNIIGKVVDGKIIDEFGNIVGEVKDGQAVSLSGGVIGTIDKNVSLDVNGNEVDLTGSDAAAAKGATHTAQVVRDANGNIIGKVVDGQVVDANGNVIGKVTASGQVQGLDGKSLGTVESVIVDSSGNVLAAETEVVRDANGNIIGKVVNGQLIDENGNVIGTVDESGNAVGLNGEQLGTAETVMLDDNGDVVGSVSEVVRDANGNIVGRVVNGQVIDINGNVVGKVNDDGSVVGLDGESLGTVETVVTGNSGSLIATEQTGDETIAGINGSSDYVDFISGGTAEDGIVPVIKVRKE